MIILHSVDDDDGLVYWGLTHQQQPGACQIHEARTNKKANNGAGLLVYLPW